MLTREQILAMPPGVELDELVAEKVLGWVRVKDQVWRWTCPDETAPGEYVYAANNRVPPCSTDIAAAWLVVERLRKRVGGFVLDDRCGENPWKAEFLDGRSTAEADTPALAICRAALLCCLSE